MVASSTGTTHKQCDCSFRHFDYHTWVLLQLLDGYTRFNLYFKATFSKELASWLRNLTESVNLTCWDAGPC